MTRLASLVLVVRNLERALVIYEQALGFTRVDEPCEVPNMGARHVFLRAENCLLELVQPHDEKSPPGLFLRQRGEGMFAMELQVDDPAKTREQLTAARVDALGTGARWYLRPGDAHGLLVEIAPADVPDPS
jgi:catechol 2,3-dioxygenase-like lactoylglutathione lyase family enzyme